VNREYRWLSPKEWDDVCKIIVDEAGILDDKWAREDSE
jgi:hypothetical protein